MIEAKIVEAEEQFGKSLGVRLGGAFASTFAAPFSSQSGPVNWGLGAQGLATSAGVQPGFMLNLPAGAAGQNLYAPPSFAVSLFNAAANQFLNLEISALEADGKGKVVASPRVVTADQTKALIEQGTELPYQVSNGNGAASISFRKANLKLEVTPQITPEGAVVLELDIAKDSADKSPRRAMPSTPNTLKHKCWWTTAAPWSLVEFWRQQTKRMCHKYLGWASCLGWGGCLKVNNSPREKPKC
jgi:type IV pilus assembly protein PilQ